MPPVALSSSIPFRGTQQYWNAINQMVEWLNAKAFPPKEALKVYCSCNLSRAFCLPLPWLWVSFPCGVAFGGQCLYCVVFATVHASAHVDHRASCGNE